MTTITERLNEWGRLAEAATEGPWTISLSREWTVITDVADVFVEVAQIGPDELPNSAPDAEFIAASREAVPALLSAVDKVLELCDEPYTVPFEEDWNEPAVLVSDIRAALAEALGVGDAE